ncbi:flagellar hook-associated protein FlgK [Alkalibaculum sporogenes]|nr:flagellar hook-associated protein FlgK [Alkalibaculum sporogenes]
MNTATKGLMAQQTALHTTSHNISNANTEGYSRQRVDLKADLAFNFAGIGQLGTGVKMEAIVRIVDDYANKQIRQESGTLAKFQTKSQVLGQIEIIFNEPSDTGLNFNLGEMFDAWQELSKNPESLTSKSIIVEKSKTLAETLNHMSDQVNNLEDETVGQLEKNAYDFNSIISQIDVLNKQIFNISVKGQVPNDLLDQRDLMLKNLSAITNVDISYDKYGRASIAIGAEEVLGVDNQLQMSMISNIEKNPDDTYTISISQGGDSLAPPITYVTSDISDLSIGQIVLNTKDAVFPADTVFNPTITSGQIAGNTEALKEIDDRRENLNSLAKTMVDAINTIHRHIGEDETGIDFFTFKAADVGDTNYAKRIQVNQEIRDDNNKVNVGYDDHSAEGDGSRALAIAGLRNIKISDSSSLIYDSLTMTISNQSGGNTIEGAYSDIVTKVGISKQHADNMVANQAVLLDQLEFRRESISGVSISEEVSNLIKFQKSYDANAKVISVLADMLDTLINRTGV